MNGHSQNKNSNKNTAGCSDPHNSKPHSSIFRTTKNVVTASLIFVGKNRCCNCSTQDHQDQNIQLSIVKSVSAHPCIELKGNFHLGLFVCRILSGSRIFFLFKVHNIIQMVPAFFIITLLHLIRVNLHQICPYSSLRVSKCL